ncbi:ABC-type proline/glycine betaine transport system substrate-binding protein [Mesobacillus stamsii]|uniref:ABC-type proline/glycine betaine transport system substrate-binding protein n=2 Tax=Mesobacillus stamsii TaxID=225347 RepID=A0ABU0FR49_9BACI|nr:ABC-type proline/glycine betaine transport system substrate-binding protein [Mesobacillus stamsii]
MKSTKKKPKKKKQIQRNFNLVMLLFLFFIALFLFDRFFDLYNESLKKINVGANSSIGEVAKYTPVIKKELEKVDLEEYTVTVAALMMQESKGKGGDPMQASESLGLAPNTIQDPQKSIQQGVKYFQQVMSYGEKMQVDFPTVIQSYNMGIGYIDYVAKNGKKHSEELAKKFSKIQVDKNPQTYNCGGNKNNFRYPYCYGDFTYSTKVAKHMETISVNNPANLIDEPTKISF